jgi:hypothetical protein
VKVKAGTDPGRRFSDGITVLRTRLVSPSGPSVVIESIVIKAHALQPSSYREPSGWLVGWASQLLGLIIKEILATKQAGRLEVLQVGQMRLQVT